HIAPVVLRPILDALAQLVRRCAGAHRADRPRGRAAELQILLNQHDIAAERARLDRGGKPAGAAGDDHNIVHRFGYHVKPSAASLAALAAMSRSGSREMISS